MTANKFQAFQKNYDNAIENIKSFLEPSKYDPPMHELVKWMMETDANPYSYLPHHWAGCVASAEMFSSLLRNIHHALYDDGDIAFVTVNGEPRIVFVWKHEDNFHNYVLTDTEKDIVNRHGKVSYTIEVLDIKPSEFGPLYDSWHQNWLKECFLGDAHRDVEQAADHYRKYRLWDESWVEEAKKNIIDFS